LLGTYMLMGVLVGMGGGRNVTALRALPGAPK
jgi:hypothetical protein